MHSLGEIMDNQKTYRNEIIDFLIKEYNDTKKELRKIKSHEDYIIKQKNRLLKKLEKIKNPINHLNGFFFKKTGKNGDFYVWWNLFDEEVNIIKYEKR